ncbi:AIPR family protein [Siccibacter turicensis]|uniref:AIPR family protein n=1 Tax=Siccibacter turicensis TaxID=357233 RepID=UPI002A6A5861|nr:AIPR family protein [Siccibacter turicensis]MDY0972292.1 AIPR family protein [Siccibacter turicensis]
MHAILQQYVQDLSTQFEINAEESKLFEYFCNYVIASKKYLGRFNPVDITTQEDDASLDGVIFIVDGELIYNVDDAEAAFNTHKTSLPVEIILTQAKSGESFLKSDISNFKVGIEDFLSLEPKLPNGIYNTQAIEILKLIFKNVKKIHNKKPFLTINFCTSGTYNAEREVEATLDIIKRFCIETDYFSKVEVKPLGRKELMDLWISITEKNEAELQLIDYIGIESMPGIPQSYIATVKAKHFIEKIAMDEDGKIKESIFEENIRAFLGDENKVNKKISETITDNEIKSKQFPVLNNGVTIISPELSIQPNTKVINLTNYQIINGCQTTNTLHHHYNEINDDVRLIVKFIESQDTDVASRIIEATNSQSAIEGEAFLALKEKARMVQKFFDLKRKDDTLESLYFERRENEYRGYEIQSTRIYDIKELARCFISVFKANPHNAARYVKKILNQKPTGQKVADQQAADQQLSEKNEDVIFSPSDNECAYFASVYICYKYNTMINGRRENAQRYNKYRWHIAMLYPWVVHGKVEKIELNSKKINSYCDKIIKTFENDVYIANFSKCHDIIDAVVNESNGDVTDDQLKRSRFTSALIEKTRNSLG